VYDSRAKRAKLKRTDRRLTLNVTETSCEELNSAGSTKAPQTIDEIRRLRNQRMQNARPILKPYVGKWTATVEQAEAMNQTSSVSEQRNVRAVSSSTVTNYDVSTSASTAICDTVDISAQPTQCHISSCSTNVKTCEYQKDEMARSVDTNCLCKEKLEQYLQAVG